MIAFPKVPVEVEAALAALARGQADGGQQQRALLWVIETLGGVNESPFVSDNPAHTQFNLGRHWVALAFLAGAGLGIVALPHLRLREEDDG